MKQEYYENVHCEKIVEVIMRVLKHQGKLNFDKSSPKKHVLIGGISSFAVVVVAMSGTAAYNNSKSQSLETPSQSFNKTKSQSSIDMSDGRFSINSATTPAEDVVSESYSESSDGESTTRQYSETTQDENGNKTTQDHSYTTNIDGSSAVDINLYSRSTSGSSTNSNSSVNVNVNSSSRVRSSGP